MNMDFYFEPCKSRTWFSVQTGTSQVYVTGWAEVNSQVLTGKDFADAVAANFVDGESFVENIAGLNGNFALVISTSDSIFLGVDTLRTVPLLYSISDNLFRVSDYINPLYSSENSLDEKSIVEFYNGGMVSGPYTLFKDIRSLQAGECIRVDRNSGKIQPHRYYRYLSTYSAGAALDDLVEQLEDITRSVFERMISSLQGRQVVIPLSGGLDSRLVVTMLKRLGYDHVFCFSYGLKDNWESRRSRAVAELLGFPWQMITYEPVMLGEVIRSDSFKQFVSLSGNAISVPEWNDWPAISVLKNKGLIERDAVVINGNSGDFIAGAHLKYLLDSAWNDDPYDVYSAIIKKHLTLWYGLSGRPEIKKILKQRIDESLSGLPTSTIEDIACLYEFWEWQERQVKFPGNQTRVYEFFGYEWRMPLWDLQIMRFWQNVPISYKMDEFLYRKQLAAFDPFRVFNDDAPTVPWSFEDDSVENRGVAERGVKHKVKKSVLRMPFLGKGLNRILHHRRLHNYYKSHPAGRCQGYGWKRFVLMEHTKRHEISIQMKDYLKMLNIQIPAVLEP